jgi:hypothetical protein
MVEIISYFGILILDRRRIRIAETCNILSFISKVSGYFFVNSHLNIYVFVSVFYVLYEFRTQNFLGVMFAKHN